MPLLVEHVLVDTLALAYKNMVIALGEFCFMGFIGKCIPNY
jgi:hypothetical protein